MPLSSSLLSSIHQLCPFQLIPIFQSISSPLFHFIFLCTIFMSAPSSLPIDLSIRFFQSVGPPPFHLPQYTIPRTPSLSIDSLHQTFIINSATSKPSSMFYSFPFTTRAPLPPFEPLHSPQGLCTGWVLLSVLSQINIGVGWRGCALSGKYRVRS